MTNSRPPSRFIRDAWFFLVLSSLAAIPSTAQVISLVRDFTGEQLNDNLDNISVDRTGSFVYAVASSNQFGTNPGLRSQIFRWNMASGIGEQLTNFDGGVESVSVSADGQWLAFRSMGNLTGANHDESVELFVMHPDGTGLAQLTNDTSMTGDGIMTAVISGSGHRIVFTSDTDPLGTNPGRTPRLFAVDRDGANLVQLADALIPWWPAAISADGTKLAFLQYDPATSNMRVMTSPADGSVPPAIVATASYWAHVIALSGDGGTVVFENSGVLGKVNWDGTGLVSPLASGDRPSITDDGHTVYYQSPALDIRRVQSDGSGDAAVAAAAPPLHYHGPVVAGDGSRLAVTTYGGQVAGGSNADGGQELVAMDAAGGSVRQLTNMTIEPVLADQTSLMSNGSRIFFRSYEDPVGGNADGNAEVFTMLPGGAGLAQVTHTTGDGIRSYSVTDAGVVVFATGSDPTGQNPCGAIQTFKTNLNGTGLTQITNACGSSPTWSALEPEVRWDGTGIVFHGYARIGTNADGNAELFRIGLDGTGLAPITDENTLEWMYFSIGTGTLPTTWIAYSSSGNRDGMNPHGLHQIARIAWNGTGYRRITADPTYSSDTPSMSGDGTKIVWTSQADFAGSNPDHSTEVFLYDATAGTIRQLSNTLGWGTGDVPIITRDGAWVYWSESSGLVRMRLATSEIQRIAGFVPEAGFRGVDTTGARTLLGGRNVFGTHTSGESLFLADQNAKPRFTVGRAAPTLLSWDPDPQSRWYDVVRGDLANATIVSNTVDLGPVTCLESRSPDNQTTGNEDAEQPAPGRAFFYLYRGTIGNPPVTGSWGEASGGLERLPGAGQCTP